MFSLNLMVFFEDPFWVGVFSRREGEQAQYCRVVFGGEPSDTQIYHYLLDHWAELEFSGTMPALPQETQIRNPKRRQREVNRTLQAQKGQKRSYSIIKQAMQTSQKAERESTRKQKEAEHAEYVFQLKQARRKEKQRGH